jgi:hypothetical protein
VFGAGDLSRPNLPPTGSEVMAQSHGPKQPSSYATNTGCTLDLDRRDRQRRDPKDGVVADHVVHRHGQIEGRKITAPHDQSAVVMLDVAIPDLEVERQLLGERELAAHLVGPAAGDPRPIFRNEQVQVADL